MKISFRGSFSRDLKKIKDRKVLGHVDEVIAEIEAASISEINQVEKLSGATNAYRVRIGGYRLGFFLEDDVIELVRCLARKDMYRYFP